MSDYAVETRSLSKIYRTGPGKGSALTALQDADLRIRPGEFFTLLGPSGCGKTTTLRLIAGFETPTSGEVFIQGQSMANIPPNRRPVNTVFQNYALFPHLSVEDNVGFGLSVKRVAREERKRRVTEALELVQLSGLGARRPIQLSGGQQQRVALARALVNRPAVLLLDEPLGALDLKLRKAMQIELKHLQEQVGITFIYVTHDQEEALTMSDRIAVMSGGAVLQVDEPYSLYEKPVNRFVADFVGETNFLQAKIEDATTEWAALTVAGASILASRPERSLLRGEFATLVIRPEKVSLAHASANGTGLKGTIREAVYIGTDTRYVVELGSGEVLVARVQNTDGAGPTLFARGERVSISWLPEHARLLTDRT